MNAVFLLSAFSALTWTDLDWKISPSCSRYVRIDNGTLTVSVPEGCSNAFAYATASLDLKDLDRSVLDVVVKAKASNVNAYNRPGRGFKVSIHHKNPATGAWSYPCVTKYQTASFDWTTIKMSLPIGEIPPSEARLVLGLQQASGEAQYDLRSLEIRKSPPLFPMCDNDRKVGYPDKIANATCLHGVMSPGAWRTTEKDIDDLKNLGAKIVRMQMNAFLTGKGKGFRGTMDDWDKWLAKWLVHIDDALGWLEARDMQMVLDLHNTPIGSYGDRSSTLTNPEHAARFVAAWEEIARRYVGRRGVYGYDLMNEPLQVVPAHDGCDYWNLQRRAAEAIRRIDKDATIIVEANDWAHPEAFTYLRALDMDNVVYSVHVYNPAFFTHQGCNGSPIPPMEKRFHYPSADGDRKICRADLRVILKPVRDFQLRHACRILVGEFSSTISSPGAAEWLSDMIDIFEEYGWDWTYHSFREARYWNAEIALDDQNRSMPCIDNPRYFVLTSGFKPTLPVEVHNRDLSLSTPNASGRCEAIVRNVTAARYRFASLASVSFKDDAGIGDSVSMSVVWRRSDGTEIRKDSVAFRDYLELGHRYRAFDEVLDVPEDADTTASIVVGAVGRVGEVRVSGIRVTDVLLMH